MFLNTASIRCIQSGPHLVFDHWECVQFNNLLLEPYLDARYLDEPYRALKIDSDVTYGQVWWPILGICALQLTHPKCTHTVNTHPEQWAAIYAAAPGEQLGVRCLAQGHLSRGIEGGESAGYSLPPPTIPAGPRLELTTFGLLVWHSNPVVLNLFFHRAALWSKCKYHGLHACHLHITSSIQTNQIYNIIYSLNIMISKWLHLFK